MQYETVRALRQAKLKNKAKPYNISDDGRCFIIVVANDKKLYQVKFNLTNTKGNQNELVTHFIGSNMNAPTLNGRLVEFSDRVLKSILDGLSKKTPNIDKSAYKQNKLFGIEWHEEARFARSEEEVKYFHSVCKNKNDFFAIFPFDQALRNRDRKHFNHIIVKKGSDEKPSHYATIDGDRIFNSPAWDKLHVEKDKYECFKDDFYTKLYDLIDDKSHKIILKFAGNLYRISDETIDLLQKTMDENYNDLKKQHSIISDILKKRKSEVIGHCNGKCFKGVSQKRLSESGQYNV